MFTTTDIVNQFLSITNFQQAWYKVAENNGCAGIDGQTISNFKANLNFNIQQLRDAVANSTYQASACKQVLIPKNKGKWRELRIPTVRDRIVQQALLNVLGPITENIFSPSSFAYRPNLSYINAVEQVALWRDNGYHWVLDGDIVKYFDNIDHQRLLTEVRKIVDNSGILCLIKAWISAGILTEHEQLRNDKGIPQGAVISPLLANIYLHEFDQKISATDLNLVRSADDFLILASREERIIQGYYEVAKILHSLGLEIHRDKTQITNFQRGFRFLGHGFLDQAIFPIDDGVAGKKKTSTTEEGEDKDVRGLLAENTIWNREMATIYLTEQGTSVFKNHQRLVIQVFENKKMEVPIREVERILVFGNIQLSTPVINACLQNKIIVLFLSSTGQYKGHLWSLESVHLHNELVQFEKRNDSYFQLRVAQAIVLGKLLNSKQLLLRLNRKRKNEEVKRAIAGINSDIAAVNSVDNLDSLRGYEGISAARYFPAFGQLITNPAFSFCHRYRQPPTDMVNSLLSFGYTLLFNNVLSLIIAEGLSPYLGSFHYGEEKKPYLAFDLMEEFRSPIVDSLVLRIVNTSLLKPKDFESVASNGGVYLNNESRRLFLKSFENRINEGISHPDIQSPVTYRQGIQLQIRRYKRSLLSSVVYEPFLRSV